MKHFPRFWTGLIIAGAGGWLIASIIDHPLALIACIAWGMAVVAFWTKPGDTDYEV